MCEGCLRCRWQDYGDFFRDLLLIFNTNIKRNKWIYIERVGAILPVCPAYRQAGGR
jgi:hypothetical protein